jgi:stage V sporulation protein B
VGMIMLLIGKYVQSFFTIFNLSHLWTVVLTIVGNIVIGFLLMFALGALDKDEMLTMIGLKKPQR